MDETNGTTATDSAGSNNGIHTNGSTVGQSGIHGKSATFDGTDDYISTGFAGVTGLNPRIVSVWFKSTNTTDTLLPSSNSSVKYRFAS